jgi:outer membrane protein assembly factor BamB
MFKLRKIFILRNVAIGVAALFLVACSSDNLEKPAPLVEFTPTINVEKVWSRSVGGTSDEYLNLQIAHDAQHLYTVSANGIVSAFAAQTGERLWRTKLEMQISGGPAAGDGLLVVGSDHGIIVALNTATGQRVWEENIASQSLGAAAIGKQYVVIKTIDDQVIALDAGNGKQLWDYNGSAPTLILRAGSTPTIVNNKVLVGLATGKLALFNLSNGLPVWQYPVAIPQGSFPAQRMVDITVSPVAKDGTVYVASYQGDIAAVQLSNAQAIWSHHLSSYTGLVLGNNFLFITDANSHVWSFQESDGGVVWRQTQLSARSITAPAILDKYVIVGDYDGYIHWMAQDSGKFVERIRLHNEAIRTAPVVIGNLLFVLDIDGHLAAYKIT